MIQISGIIDSNPEILGGKPIIKGTRIPVDLIFELLGLNYSIDYILDQYPTLNREILQKMVLLSQNSTERNSGTN